ncbi:MAG: hypothetical protein AAGJ79_14405, partial [Verrucomicrobiota bacterium]
MDVDRDCEAAATGPVKSGDAWDFWLGVGLVIHFAGILFFENWVMQNLWGAAVIVLTARFRGRELRVVWKESAWVRWLGAWLAVQFFAGFFLAQEQEGVLVYFLRAWDVLAVPFVLLIWVHLLQQDRRIGEMALGFIALVGLATAVVSFLAFYSTDGFFPRARLMNQLVNWWWNNGMHPVLTGLLFSFAAICLLLLLLKEDRAWLLAAAFTAFPLLLFISFFSHTRGALLALVAALPVALLSARNMRAVLAFLLAGLA